MRVVQPSVHDYGPVFYADYNSKMAQKATETAVRELQKNVADLTKRICDLECKIVEQNVIITKQSESIIKLKSAVEGTPKTQLTEINVPAVPVNTTQARPMRQARFNAAAAKTSKVSNNKRTSVSSSSSTTYSDVTHCMQKEVLSVATKPVTSGTVIPNSTIDKPVENNENNYGDGKWQTVTHKRKMISTKKRKIVTGTGNQNADLQTVERVRCLQAWSLKPETTEDNITVLHKNKTDIM